MEPTCHMAQPKQKKMNKWIKTIKKEMQPSVWACTEAGLCVRKKARCNSASDSESPFIANWFGTAASYSLSDSCLWNNDNDSVPLPLPLTCEDDVDDDLSTLGWSQSLQREKKDHVFHTCVFYLLSHANDLCFSKQWIMHNSKYTSS